MTQAQNDRTDAAMLQSMASSLRAGMGFSFNPMDMADLLDRVAAKVAPRPKLAMNDGGSKDAALSEMARLGQEWDAG